VLKNSALLAAHSLYYNIVGSTPSPVSIKWLLLLKVIVC